MRNSLLLSILILSAPLPCFGSVIFDDRQAFEAVLASQQVLDFSAYFPPNFGGPFIASGVTVTGGYQVTAENLYSEYLWVYGPQTVSGGFASNGFLPALYEGVLHLDIPTGTFALGMDLYPVFPERQDVTFLLFSDTGVTVTGVVGQATSFIGIVSTTPMTAATLIYSPTLYSGVPSSLASSQITLSFEPTSIPEPSTIMLSAAGLVLLIAKATRRA